MFISTLQFLNRKAWLPALLLLLFSINAKAQNSALPPFYNYGTPSGSNSFPLNTSASNKVQWIYGPNLFKSNGTTGTPARSGRISKIYFMLGTTSNPTSTYSNFTIKLGQTVGTQTSWSSGTYLTNLTTVFYAPSFTITGAFDNAWIEIPLQTPIYYNPNLSLVFEMSVTGGTGNSVTSVTNTGLSQRIYGSVTSATGTAGAGLVNFGIETRSVTPNDAGVVAIDSPVYFCAGRFNIRATIENMGNNQLDTVTVNWSLNDTVQTPILYTNKLDTALGSGSARASILLGNYNFRANSVTNIKVWTSRPNNKNDTVNFNDTMSIVLRPSLSGTYTIGGTSPDFATFNDAVSSINSYGVCGPVTFNVRNGIYRESIKIDAIGGASATNTITFQSASGNSSQVILQDSATATASNYVVQLNGTDYIRFKNMTIQALGATYARALDVLSGATYNEFHNNVFLGISTTTSNTNNAVIYSAGTNDDYNLFMNNRIVGGSYGMYYRGTSSSVWEKGTRIIGNELQDQYVYGIYFFYHQNAEIRKNIITTSSTIATYYGLYLSNVYDTTAITENQVIRTNGGGYGFYFTNIEGSYIGDTVTAIQVSNNYISLAGTSTSYGIYNNASIFINYHHNTVAIYGTSATAGRVLSIAGASSYLSVYNNNFANLGGGYIYYALSAQTGAIDSSDYNNLYTTGTNIAYWGSAITGGLSGWQNTTLMDTNSISVNPQFISNTDYTPENFALKNAAIKLTEVDFDIEGRERDTVMPDIGAVEIYLDNDVSIESLILPDNNVCGSRAHQVGLVIKNRGIITQDTIPVELMINNNPATIIRDTLTGALALNKIDTIYIRGGINTVAGGNYSLKIFTNLAGDERNINDTATAAILNVKPAPIPGFTFNTPCFGESVRFVDTSKGNLLGANFFWDFGDGNRVLDYNPEYFYSAPGTYQAKLIVVMASGCADSFVTAVTVHPIPVADFSADTVCRGTPMSFSDSSTVATGTIATYNWNFGDGNTSAMQNPAHIYTTAGTYNVSLIVASNNGCMDTISRQVTVLPAPTANFTAVNSCHNSAVQFTDSSVFSTGVVINRKWNFGDGNTSTDVNPAHIYSAPGTYNVMLVVKNNHGCDDSVTKQVIVYPNPVAAFSASLGCEGKDVTFTNNSTISSNNALTYIWSFGDGGTSNNANPVHNYTQAGTYNVKLVAVSGNGCIDSVSKTITVHPLPNPDWSLQTGQGRTVTFLPEDTTLVSYRWEYGDGNFSTRMKPTRTYSADGTYIVTLTVLSATGCENSLTDTITITNVGINEMAAPQIGLSVFPNPFTESTTVTYELEKASNISISVYDMAGKEVAKIADKVQASGKQQHTFDAAQHNLKAGIYMLRIMVDNSMITKQIIRLK